MNELISHFSLGGTGKTIVIKDSIDIGGMPTGAGSRGLADAPPAKHHADVVERLMEANWHIVGKANMHELAFGMTGINDYTGTPTNPQAPDRIPGGSSSGSAAAVGAGLADAALGSDTGGSIRGPAACCGVIGMKPTFGRVSRVGAAPAVTTLDSVGPFARSMAVLIEVMAAITPGFDPIAAQACGPGGRGFRVGVFHTEADPEISDAVATAVGASGLAYRTVDVPGLEAAMTAAFNAGLVIINAETSAAFGYLTGKGMLGADLEARLVNAAKTTPEMIAAAEQVRRVFTAAVDTALEKVDVLVLPTMPSLPITIDAARSGASVIAVSSLIRPFNLSGHPALSLPIPMKTGSIKAGLQIVGRHGADEMVCAVATMFERGIEQADAIV